LSRTSLISTVAAAFLQHPPRHLSLDDIPAVRRLIGIAARPFFLPLKALLRLPGTGAPRSSLFVDQKWTSLSLSFVIRSNSALFDPDKTLSIFEPPRLAMSRLRSMPPPVPRFPESMFSPSSTPFVWRCQRLLTVELVQDDSLFTNSSLRTIHHRFLSYSFRPVQVPDPRGNASTPTYSVTYGI